MLKFISFNSYIHRTLLISWFSWSNKLSSFRFEWPGIHIYFNIVRVGILKLNSVERFTLEIHDFLLLYCLVRYCHLDSQEQSNHSILDSWLNFFLKIVDIRVEKLDSITRRTVSFLMVHKKDWRHKSFTVGDLYLILLQPPRYSPASWTCASVTAFPWTGGR